MKAKFITAIVLIGSILFTGCAQSVGNSVNTSKSEAIVLGTESDSSKSISDTTKETSLVSTQETASSTSTEDTSSESESGKFISTIDPSEFTGPSDENFLQYVKDATYAEAIKNLNSTEYVVENVEVTYISPEYIAELEYNSKANIYFGHTEEELAKQFDGEQVVFTMDDKGQTSVEKFVPNAKGLDPAYKKALIKTGIGVGVILVCVVVSIATQGTAAAAIFAYAAKSAAVGAAISGTTGGVFSGLVEGFRNKNFDRAAKAAAESAGDGIMWGSIFSGIAGGVSEFKFLRKFSKLTKLKMKDIALIQKESKLPLEVIAKLNSMDEYRVLRDAKLTVTEMNVKNETHAFLTRDIDWKYIDPSTITAENPQGLSNLQLAMKGNAPFDPSGKRYQLHHVGQHEDTVFAVLTEAEHVQIPKPGPAVNRKGFDAFRRDFWRKMASLANSGIIP